MVEFDPRRDYPLASERPDLVTTPGGLTLDEVTLDIPAAEIRATGRTQLAENLERAAELASVPDEALLELYTALRPRRSTAPELEACAARLEGWGAERTAEFVREAAAVYAERGLLA